MPTTFVFIVSFNVAIDEMSDIFGSHSTQIFVIEGSTKQIEGELQV